MNERWGVAPRACSTGEEWRSLLRMFGPEAGRYIVLWPMLWHGEVLRAIRDLPNTEQARAETALQNALTAKALLRLSPCPSYNETKSWVENLLEQHALRESLKAVVAPRGSGAAFLDIDSFNPPLTVARAVRARAADLANTCETLLRLSPLLHFVDPKFDPTLMGHRRVMIEMLRRAALGDCRQVSIWVRKRDCRSEVGELRRLLRMIEDESSFPRGRLCLRLVCDERTTNKLHNRYVFGPHGGIELGQGFQELNDTMSLSPMAGGIFEQQWAWFAEGEADFTQTPSTCEHVRP